MRNGDVAGPAHHDIVILGTGTVASALAAVLVRHGVKVVMAGDEAHPAAGLDEMGAEVTRHLRVLGARYKVPEFQRFAAFEPLLAELPAPLGAELCHSFVYQRPGRSPEPSEVMQVSMPAKAPPEPNLRRPALDRRLREVAESLGASVRTGAKVARVSVADGVVTVTDVDGERLTADYLVDASGPGSVFLTDRRLIEPGSRFTTRTRSLYARLAGGRPMEEVMRPAKAYGKAASWTGGSTHHLFAGGYLRAIPFGNHPGAAARSTGVTLTLDADLHPEQGAPQEQFAEFLSRYPALAEQFEGAEPVEPWVSTGRHQHSVSHTVGHRWCVIGDAAGYVDPFNSRALAAGLGAVNMLAWRLLEAVRDGDYATERFEPLDRFTRRSLNANDDLTAMLTASLCDAALAKSALYVLQAGFRFGGFPALDAYGQLLATGSDAAFRELEKAPYPGSLFPTHAGYQRLFTTAAAECAAVASGRAEAAEAAGRVFAAVREADFVPAVLGLDDPATRFVRLTPATVLRLVLWSFTRAPDDLGPLVRRGLRIALRGR
uniref:Flavin-dependent halogenase n=1 Tax=Streptomyces sp. CNH287 TaxID=1288082 RepID=U6A120_9ACTN|nr:flavin-dependent halogenase [Streptomyces sp. CNH287]